MVYDPDSGLVTDIVACEDAHASERTAALPLLERAHPDQVWIADRPFCTGAMLQGWEKAGACFIVREHGRHPRLTGQSAWQAHGRTETGKVREQAIEINGGRTPWRRIELALDVPMETGERVIRLWSNLPGRRGPTGCRAVSQVLAHRGHVPALGGRAA